MKIAPDGSLLVREDITFSYAGSFSGAYRDIPVRDGRDARPRAVSEGGRALPARRQHRARELRPPGHLRRREERRPGARSSGTTGDRTSSRTFTIAYRFRGLAVAYDDVVDVNLKVWGDRLARAVYDLRAEMVLPRPVALTGTRYRVWGAPAVGARRRRATRTGDVAARRSTSPAGQFVEMRTVFPRRLLTSTRGRARRRGQRLREDRRRADGARRGLRRRPREARRRERQPRPDAADALRASRSCRRSPSCSSSGSSSGASAAPATTASTSRSRPTRPAGDRAAAPAPGHVSGLARVHRHALRPHPARLLRREAGDDREEDLGGPAHGAGRGPRAVARATRRSSSRRSRSPSPRSSTTSSTTGRSSCRRCATASRRPRVEQQALRALQGGRRRGDRQAPLVRRHAARRPSGSLIAALVVAPSCCSGWGSPASGRWRRAGTTSS